MAEEPKDLVEVQRRLKEIQTRKHDGIRWHMSRETAEMALVALEEEGSKPAPRSGKSRRRKRKKRLL